MRSKSKQLRLSENIKVHDEHVVSGSNLLRNHNHKFTQLILLTTVEPRFNEVGGDWSNLFIKWRVRYIENLDITNLRGKGPKWSLYRGHS